MMSKIVKIGIGVAIAVALVAGGIKAVKKARAKDANTPKAKIYPVVVSTMTPKISHVRLTLPYLAEVANDKDVRLTSRISARIISIKPSGSKVKKGDVVVKLDTTDIQSSLQSIKEQMSAAKIALKNLQLTHARTVELLKVKGASIEESQKEATLIANAKAQLQTLKQKEIALKNSLSYATIVSPVDGIVSKTFSSKGALGNPAKPLIAISSKNGFYLKVRVPTDLNVLGVILDGKKYTVNALESTFHGLEEYKVYVNDKKLISGDRVEVSVITFNANGVKLPFDAVLNREGKSYVLVVNGERADAKEVHILQSAQEGIVISENLQGEKVVVAKPDILLKLTSGYLLKVKG